MNPEPSKLPSIDEGEVLTPRRSCVKGESTEIVTFKATSGGLNKLSHSSEQLATHLTKAIDSFLATYAPTASEGMPRQVRCRIPTRLMDRLRKMFDSVEPQDLALRVYTKHMQIRRPGTKKGPGPIEVHASQRRGIEAAIQEIQQRRADTHAKRLESREANKQARMAAQDNETGEIE